MGCEDRNVLDVSGHCHDSDLNSLPTHGARLYLSARTRRDVLNASVSFMMFAEVLLHVVFIEEERNDSHYC